MLRYFYRLRTRRYLRRALAPMSTIAARLARCGA